MKTNGHFCAPAKQIQLVFFSVFLGLFTLKVWADDAPKKARVTARSVSIHKKKMAATHSSRPASTFSNKKEGTNLPSSSAKNNSVKRRTVSVTGNESLVDKTVIRFQATTFAYPEHATHETGITQYEKEELMLYVLALKKFAKQHGYDTAYAFFANMAMAPTKKRFFVVNLSTLEIHNSGLVSHGFGNASSIYNRTYSNKPGSRCTSLGKYSLMGKYSGVYGEAFKLRGLDSSNSNAVKRKIVLHTMGCIPEKEGFAPACSSEGCPAVAKQFFVSIKKIVESRKKPVLLWVFDSQLEQPVVELPTALLNKLRFFEHW